MNFVARSFKRFKKVFGVSTFNNSQDYWRKRYEKGGNSGLGSYDHYAVFKADVLNAFFKENHIQSVVEFGCGDGNQLS